MSNIKSSSKKGHAVRLQYGALPYHFTKGGELEILLVTTRRSKRWTIPKGWPISSGNREGEIHWILYVRQAPGRGWNYIPL
jgi:hypothetical protein